MGKFIITGRPNGEYIFNLVADNSQVILFSEIYTTKAACENGIAAVTKNSQNESAFERRMAKNGKFYFNLKAANGQIIGASPMYESESGRENGIYSVKRNAIQAEVEFEYQK